MFKKFLHYSDTNLSQRNNKFRQLQNYSLQSELAIEKSTADQHNIMINVSSELETGSCFTFTLPVVYRDFSEVADQELSKPELTNYFQTLMEVAK
jgi:light-regulated signal transduction histidine kinase (bacteriophytochrome)